MSCRGIGHGSKKAAQAKLQRLQNPGQVQGDILKIRNETGMHFRREKEREYLTEKCGGNEIKWDISEPGLC
jgi:hypothetical protein